jgi:hypothetical protein
VSLSPFGRFRWWLFKRISDVGWRICPEPHRANLQRYSPNWQQVDDYLTHLSSKGNKE